MLEKCAWAALAVVLAACKNGVPQPPAALPDTCSGDSECGANFRCDREMRRCVCTSDTACKGDASGEFCNVYTGLCVGAVGGCSAVPDAGTVHCGQGQYCNTALRTCKAVTSFCQPCKGDAECGPGSACAAHPDFPSAGTFCVSACDGAGACANQLACRTAASGAKLCYPPGACGVSNACVPDSLRLCSADLDCADPAQTCDLSLKACIARSRTCPAGDACDPQSRLCVQACATDLDCLQIIEKVPGYQCRANACFRLALCAQDSDCTGGQICQANSDGSKSCHAGCVTNADCPLGSGCNTTDPNHPRCNPGCTVNTDCALNTICDTSAHLCTPSAPPACAQYCQDTAVCPIGANCSNSCCVETNLPATCGGTNCGNCVSGGISPGCNQNCSIGCFPMNLGSCASLADCQAKYPALGKVVCNTGLGQCQVLGQLQPCTPGGVCTMKGFKCIANFGTCGPSVCVPVEQAAQIACALGHP